MPAVCPRRDRPGDHLPPHHTGILAPRGGIWLPASGDGPITGIRELHITSGTLTSLPDSFTSLQSLSELSLHCRQLAALPQDLDWLTNLTSLKLECSSLQTMPPELIGSGGEQHTFSTHIIAARLEWMVLRGLRSKLPQSFSRLHSNLRIFTLEEDPCPFPHHLGHLPRLERLDLVRCSVMEKLPKTFAQLRTLTHLSINQCDALEVLPDGLEHAHKSGVPQH